MSKYNITLSQVPKPEDEVERAEWPYQRLSEKVARKKSVDNVEALIM